MDPNATLSALLDELADHNGDNHDRDAIVEHLENLKEWIANGGFLPSVTNFVDDLETITVTVG